MNAARNIVSYTFIAYLRTFNVYNEDVSSPVPLTDLYFVSFYYPVAPIVSSAGGIVACVAGRRKERKSSARLSPFPPLRAPATQALFNSFIYLLLSQ